MGRISNITTLAESFRLEESYFRARTDLALEMGWFKKKVPPPDDPWYSLELGPNLVMELRDDIFPTSGDLKYSWDADWGTSRYPNRSHVLVHTKSPRWITE